ncbi:outer membrane protein assembly factor BamD [Pseudomarimonas salicorniae]|uniref:Outer membrane protein assembly factor BamD n=1 Tax=Pseudomarimonas salicorniae TaxID=2933270 RepID=A0ABT0GFJ9_9GAMM|nr:outer membrane protein assembly factor BamD [Lysobacter sp. CAU 1642]MCK7593317.1 outer membrane protein assembly factor BamD [Lysobacter sp. CAU 1642]
MIHHQGLLRPAPRTALPSLARIGCLFLLALSLAGCKWFQKEDPLETLPVDQMYAEAKSALVGGNLGRATRYYQRLIARFPYGPYTEQAQLELAYAQHRNNEPEDALSTINRFIRTYPAHDKVAYAFYLKALINFERGNSALDRLVGIDATQRDQAFNVQSFNDFAEVIRRFPDTRYAVDARQRMVYLRNRLARHEINVAQYYLRRKAWVAALKRGQYLIEVYPQSRYQSDALAVMAESYRQLGQDTLADDTVRVLEANDPQHPYLTGGWPRQGGWWRKLLPFGDERRGS